MKSDQIILDHGSGGKISHHLISETILPIFDNPILSGLDDCAVVEIGGMRISFSTDTYVVDPIFFPGGNIGELAVNGTVNDIAMSGAAPMVLSTGLVIEEGFPLSDLKMILKSMKQAADKAKVSLVTGDTKVVPKGAADKIFINTSGIGIVPENIRISGRFARPGDVVISSGTIADHGIAVLIQREGMNFDASVFSDTAPLNHMIRMMLNVTPQGIHTLRDPTRGGVGTTLNEIAQSSGVGIKIYENKIPVKPEVSGICELLGFDPLYIANEGKLLAFVDPSCASKVLSVLKSNDLGKEACIIGEAVSDHPGRVVMQTRIGGTRIVDMLAGEQLPRIC